MSDNTQTERPGQDTPRSSGEVHINVKTEGTIGLPPELLECAFGEISQIVRCLFDSLRLDLSPCADGDVTTGTDNLVCRFSFNPFDYRFQGSPTFPTSNGNASLITHSSSPIDSKQAASDSTSEKAEKSVAQPAFELSVEELMQINLDSISPALAGRAFNELMRRTGVGEASS